MTENAAPNPDGAKTKCRDYNQTLKQLSTILPFNLPMNMTDKRLKILSVCMTALKFTLKLTHITSLYIRKAEILASPTRLSGTAIGLFVRQEA
jgi:hypothetical protein